MAKTINSDLIRGNINTIILKALYDGDRYGYDIIKEIELKSHGQYILKQPTLYSCLKRLENQGFIEAYWGEQTSNGGRRKYYRLTEEGKEIFKQSQDEYEYSRTVIDNLISDNQYDLSSLAPLVNTESDDENEEMSEKDNEKTVITEPQQLSMDVSELEITTPSAIENKEIIIDEIDEKENVSSIETINEYVQPAPVFTEVEANDASNNKPVSNIEVVEETSTANSSETVDFNYDIPKINNSEYINSLLNQNIGSYFGRTDENIEVKNQNTSINNTVQTNNDVDDDIEKRLEALRMAYHQEIEQASENSNQNTYQPKALFTAPKADNITPPLSFSDNKNTENYNNGFYRYNVQHSGITDQQKEEPVTYRSLSSLIEEKNSSPITQSTPSPKPVSIKEQIKIRNFGKLSESIEELGENVKLRPHYDTKHDYKKQYYYRDSYLRLFHFGIMFLMMLMEVFMIYIIGKRTIGADTPYDISFYIISIIACFILPVFAGAIYIYRPNSKKRNDYNLKSSIIFRLIVAIQLILIIYALNIWMGMPITFDGKYFVTLVLPLIFAINFPISALIFNTLRKNEKFALKE